MSDPTVLRRCTRLIAAVHELHKQGYQDLALYCGMAPSGCFWRYQLVPFSKVFYHRDQFELRLDGVEEAKHSAGALGYDYFGWTDCQTDTARTLAEKIKARFPRLLVQCNRTNLEYAGWLTLALGKAESGSLPVMYDDSGFSSTTLIRTTTDEMLIRPPFYQLLDLP